MHHNDNEVCVTVVDVTKQEIERPKKDSATGIPERKNDTRQKH